MLFWKAWKQVEFEFLLWETVYLMYLLTKIKDWEVMLEIMVT